MRKCRKCKAEKDDGLFREWGGKPGHVCDSCKGDKPAAKKVAKKKRRAPVIEVVPELALAFPPGYGFSSRTEADSICIQQSSDGSDDTVWLSRAEFATLIAHYGTWAGERAA